ncbi:hypothetical protein cypCar_00002764 [Cyprinus carpio]|nr:hypothetical protein cypCar_00002764 [Cyprinus carpio]
MKESLMLGTEMDLQLVEGTVVALENSLKMWLHDQGGDREHLHLLLPPSLTLQGSTQHPANNRPSPVCLKCDMQERLLSPALLPSTPDLGVKTESMQDFQPPNKSLANQNPSPQSLRSSLDQLEKDPVFNPLGLDSNLHSHLRIKGLLTRSSQPFGAHGQGRGHRRGASRPQEGSTQRQGRQTQSRVRATVAPLPSIPLNKMPRRLVTLSHSRPCAPALFFQDNYEEEDPLMIQ